MRRRHRSVNFLSCASQLGPYPFAWGIDLTWQPGSIYIYTPSHLDICSYIWNPCTVRTCWLVIRPCVDLKSFWFWHCSTFVFIWQILFNYGVSRLKDSSHDLQIKYAISFYFYLYLMFHACAARFDLTENLEKFLVFGWTKQGLRGCLVFPVKIYRPSYRVFRHMHGVLNIDYLQN